MLSAASALAVYCPRCVGVLEYESAVIVVAKLQVRLVAFELHDRLHIKVGLEGILSETIALFLPIVAEERCSVCTIVNLGLIL